MSDIYGQVKGTLAAKSTAVTDAAANQVGDFQGDCAFNLVAESAEWLGQDYWRKLTWMTVARASLNVAEVAYQPNKIDTIFGITSSVGDTKETTPVTASVGRLDTTWTGPAPLEWLVTTQRKNDSNKKFQVWTYGQMTGDFPISLGHGQALKYALGVDCSLDSSEDLARFIFEN